jgi:hypothetical protein
MNATRAHFKQTVYFAEREWQVQFKSNVRLRHFACIMFRHIFGGLKPTKILTFNGSAMVYDARGNQLDVEQRNWFHPFYDGATTMPRPLCPMVIRKEACRDLVA